MKKAVTFALILFFSTMSFAQFKSQSKLPALSQVIAKPNNGLIFGFINPEKFSMHHSFSMNYMTLGNGQGMMINSYMNTIDYQISNPLWLRLNLGIANSPYNSFQNSALNSTQFFGSAELFYRPTENSMVHIGLDVQPNYYRPGFRNDWYGW